MVGLKNNKMKNVKKALENTNWEKFQAQKELVIEKVFCGPDEFEDWDGLLSWIDAIQDAAVSDGMDENIIFNLKKEQQ